MAALYPVSEGYPDFCQKFNFKNMITLIHYLKTQFSF